MYFDIYDIKRNSAVRSYLVTKEVLGQEHMLKSGGIIHSFVANTKSLYMQESEFRLLIPSILSTDFVDKCLFRLLSGHIHMTTLRCRIPPYDGYDRR